jgi:protein-disulfide isomerase
VLKRYPKKVKLTLKNYPLPNHDYAKKAAIAALATHRQGKYWEMHDLIFADYKQLNDAKFKEFAVTLKLDMDQFDSDRADQKIQSKVDNDMREGKQAGVRGTPTIFINGKLLRQRSIDGFKRAIDLELKKLSATN